MLYSYLHNKSTDKVLSLTDALAASELFQIRLKEVEQAALSHDIWPEPYLRHRFLFTARDQLQLLNSTVAIIGCGGLGGQIFEQCLRLGIGQLIVVDPDRFAAHNLNRQQLCTMGELGYLKVEAAVRRGRAVNPAVTVTAEPTTFIQVKPATLKQAQVMLDGLDSAADRQALADFCHDAHIPLVHGAVDKWYGQIGVQKRSELIKQLYPHIPAGVTNSSPATLCCTVSTIASLQIAETVKILLGHDSPLQDNWISIDLATCDFEMMEERKNKN